MELKHFPKNGNADKLLVTEMDYLRCSARLSQMDSLTHGAEPFLRSCQLCSYSGNSQHFMGPEGSLPCSQEPSTSHYPEPDQSNPIHTIPSYLSKIHFNIIHLPTSWSSQWSFWLSHQYPICIPLLPHSCYMPYPVTNVHN
jgi:hypothetical protein